MLEKYGVTWFEEPLKPDALEDYVQLRRNASVPIAGGEVLTRCQSFTAWLQRGAFNIVQPDAVAPHVRFDERGWETGLHATAPVLDSTGDSLSEKIIIHECFVMQSAVF